MASNSKDLSHIQSLSDLQREINNLKAEVVVEEAQLQARRKHLPVAAKQYAIQKLLPATIKKVVPFVLTRGAVARTFGFVRNAIGLVSVFKKQSDKSLKNTLFTAVKKLSAAAAARGVMNWIRNRKNNHLSPQNVEVS